MTTMPYKDPEKARASNREWCRHNRERRRQYERDRARRIREEGGEEYKATLAYAAEKNAAWRQQQRFLYQALMAGRKCEDCGSKTNLDWHHVDPEAKELSIGNYTRASWSRILKELEKCVCVCRRCHKRRHAELALKSYEIEEEDD
jgi:hypothetical protein